MSMLCSLSLERTDLHYWKQNECLMSVKVGFLLRLALIRVIGVCVSLSGSVIFLHPVYRCLGLVWFGLVLFGLNLHAFLSLSVWSIMYHPLR